MANELLIKNIRYLIMPGLVNCHHHVFQIERGTAKTDIGRRSYREGRK